MREKMKGMTLIQKIDYLWTYYKIWLLVPVGIGFVIYMGCSIYRAQTENVLVNAVVVGSTLQDTEDVSRDVKKYMGKDGKHDVVTLQTNIPDDNLGQASTVALSTIVGARTVDVMICPKNVYEHFSGQQAGSIPMKDMLGDKFTQYGDIVQEDAVVVSDSQFMKDTLGIPYEEVYMFVVANAPHRKGVAQFVQYVLDNL